MAARVVLAFDVGTSGVKAVLVDAQRGIVASAGRGYGLSTPAPGWVDQDVLAIRRSMARATRELLRERDVRVEAVSVTAQMFSLQPVDPPGLFRRTQKRGIGRLGESQKEARMLPAERGFFARRRHRKRPRPARAA